jgi:Yip1 domain
MSMEPAQPPAEMAPPQQSFIDVWVKALTKPSVATYEEFVSRPGVSLGRAFSWVFVAAFVGSIFGFLGVILSGNLSNLGLDQSSEFLQGVSFPFLLFVCGVPLSAAFSIVGLVIVAGISQLAARLLGGVGTFTQLAYAFAAYLAPMSIVTSVLGLIPFVACLNVLLGLYGLVLNVIAVKAVHRFDWGRAVIASVAFVVVILVIGACVAAIFLALLGPVIGTVFSNVIQGLETPLP